jgi:hypothetical protein
VHFSGQHSWVAVAVLLGVVAIRLLSSQRRRGMDRPGGPPGASGLTGSSRPAPEQTSSTESTFTGTAPGWFTDPFVRHEQRYWSGTSWTEHVLDGGAPAVDPPPAPPDRG